MLISHVAGQITSTKGGLFVMAPEAHDRILRINAVLDRTGLTRSTLYRKVANGTFPPQIKISERCAGWRESAVNAWMRNPIYYEVTDDDCAGS